MAGLRFEGDGSDGGHHGVRAVLRQLLTPGLHRVLMRERKTIGGAAAAAAAANFLGVARSPVPVARPSLIWNCGMRGLLGATLERECAEIDRRLLAGGGGGAGAGGGDGGAGGWHSPHVHAREPPPFAHSLDFM